jgi:hypothetical protein
VPLGLGAAGAGVLPGYGCDGAAAKGEPARPAQLEALELQEARALLVLQALREQQGRPVLRATREQLELRAPQEKLVRRARRAQPGPQA